MVEIIVLNLIIIDPDFDVGLNRTRVDLNKPKFQDQFLPSVQVSYRTIFVYLFPVNVEFYRQSQFHVLKNCLGDRRGHALFLAFKNLKFKGYFEP
jgi:hypothetical protein